jgi:hypothetical protein
MLFCDGAEVLKNQFQMKKEICGGGAKIFFSSSQKGPTAKRLQSFRFCFGRLLGRPTMTSSSGLAVAVLAVLAVAGEPWFRESHSPSAAPRFELKRRVGE